MLQMRFRTWSAQLLEEQRAGAVRPRHSILRKSRRMTNGEIQEAIDRYDMAQEESQLGEEQVVVAEETWPDEQEDWDTGESLWSDSSEWQSQTNWDKKWEQHRWEKKWQRHSWRSEWDETEQVPWYEGTGSVAMWQCGKKALYNGGC